MTQTPHLVVLDFARETALRFRGRQVVGAASINSGAMWGSREALAQIETFRIEGAGETPTAA
jgi:hypothetical protein